MKRKIWRLLSVFLILSMVSLAPASTPRVFSAESGPTLRALKLNGNGSYLEVENHSLLNPLSAITIEAWVYRNDDSRCETVVGKNFTTSYWLGFCNQTIRFYTHGGGTHMDGNTAVLDGVWTHIAVTYDGTTRRYYVNGQLDLESSALGGSLVENSSPLVIGDDPAFPTSYNFSGRLDEVRLWFIARTQEEIQADMYRQIDFAGGLLGIWRMNGTANDLHSRFATSSIGDVRYETNGVLPFNLMVPLAPAAPVIDGDCNTSEYAAAERLGFSQGAQTTAYIQHTADDLYVCISQLEMLERTSAAVAIDRDKSRDALAQPGDYRFRVTDGGATSSEQGDGAGGWQDLPNAPGEWQAAASGFEFYWSAEFRISRELLGMPENWSLRYGLDLVAFGPGVDPSHFPVGAIENSPLTWSEAGFYNTSGVLPTHQFSGRVEDDLGNRIPGVNVYLSGSSLIATTLTDSNGEYQFSYTGYSPANFYVQEEDPRGAYSLTASAGADGAAITPNVLVYPGAPTSKVYSPGAFVDDFGVSYGPNFAKHYLIIYSAPVREADLGALIGMKRMQGFRVETVSTQSIEATISGLDLIDKIRNWLESRWEMHRPAPIYALLIGRGDKIPVPDYGRPDARDYDVLPEDPLYVPLLQTDWYFADLDSTWDIDRDRRLGECMLNLIHDPVLCEPDNPVYNEGPYGTSPESFDDWVPEISIGRLAINDPAAVRRALATSAATEMSSSADKKNAILAGAFWSFEHYSWNAETESYVDEWVGDIPLGDDTAEHLELGLKPILEPVMDNITRLYNSTTPASNPAAPSRTRFVPDFPLTHENMLAVWQNQAFGLVHVTGHGAEEGVDISEGLWTNDFNNDGIVNHPANPAVTNCPDTGCAELSHGGLYIDFVFPPPGGIAPVVFARTCLTGQVGWRATGIDPDGDGPATNSFVPGRDAIAGILSGRGSVAVWIGAQMLHVTHGSEQVENQFAEDMLEGPLLIGDALWKAQRDNLAGQRVPDWRLVNLQVFGDPAYSYWGNPLDMRAYWPQAGRDWFASSSSPANGPSMGIKLWTATAGNPRSTPVVDRYGNIFVAGSNQITRFTPDGTVADSASLPAGAEMVFQPAITTDSIYLGTDFHRYRFDHELNLIEDFASPIYPQTGPTQVGPDGVIWEPIETGMLRRSPGGVKLISSNGSPQGHVAYSPSGEVTWVSQNGSVHALNQHKMDPYGNESGGAIYLTGSAITSPAGSPDGSFYIGNSHDLVKIQGDFEWSYPTGASITATPTVSATGMVYVGNAAGDLLALTPEGDLRWSTNLGAPILTTPAVDNSRVYVTAGSRLYALDAVTGANLWSVDLGGSVDERSSPVIGANRTLYVTTSDGRLVAVGQSLWLVAPSITLVEAGIESATVHWRDNSSGESGFRIELCSTAGICSLAGEAPADADEFTAIDLPAGEEFFFRVQALAPVAGVLNSPAAALESSDFNHSDSFTPLAPVPSTPHTLSAIAQASDAIEIDWGFSGDPGLILGFDILRSEQAASGFVPVGAVSASTTSFVDKGLEPDKTYFYKVQALADSGPSLQAGPASATTLPQSLPAPTGFHASVRSGQITLTWVDHATNETGYLLEREAPGGQFEILASLPANTTNTSDDYLLADGTFTYRIRATADHAESPFKITSVTYPGQVLYLPVMTR